MLAVGIVRSRVYLLVHSRLVNVGTWHAIHDCERNDTLGKPKESEYDRNSCELPNHLSNLSCFIGR